MNQTSKKLFSVLLTVAMLFSLGTPAMATDGQQTDNTDIICAGTSGVECTATTHVAGCDEYEAPVVTCTGDAAVEDCAAETHVKGCDKYVPVCSALEGCDAEQNVHNEECELYVAPVVCTKGEDCVAEAHETDCVKYVVPCTKGEDCAAEAHETDCVKYVVPCTKGEDCAAETHEADCKLYDAPCKEGCAVEGEHDVCMTADEIAAAEAKAKAEAEAALIAEINTRIAALPTLEAVQAMDMDALTALNSEITAISLEIDKLSDKSVIDTTSIAAVANELNTRIATLEEDMNDGINTEEELKNALTTGGDIVLTGNIVVDAGLTVPAGVTVTLDLAGYTVSREVSSVSGNDQLILNRGVLTITDTKGGGKLTFNYTGGSVQRSVSTIANYGTLIINGGTIENISASGYAFAIDSLTNVDGGVTKDVSVTINGGTVVSNYVAIRQFVNGSYTNKLVVKNGNISGYRYGIWTQGASSEADGVYDQAVLDIDGGTIKATTESNPYAVVMCATNNASISGGNFYGYVYESPDGNNNYIPFISGGTFDTDVEYVVTSDSKMDKNEDGTYSVAVITSATVSDYDELKAALANENITEITLTGDITAEEVLLIGRSLTINGEGHSITSSASRVFRLTAPEINVTMNNVKMVSTAERKETNDIRGISFDNECTNSTLILNACSVDFTHASADDWSYAVNTTPSAEGNTITIDGGTYEGANVININSTENTITVTGATLTSLYAYNEDYVGGCIYMSVGGNTLNASNNTFEGGHAVAINNGKNATNEVIETNNTDNTHVIVYVAELNHDDEKIRFESLEDAAEYIEEHGGAGVGAVSLLADTEVSDEVSIDSLDCGKFTVTVKDGGALYCSLLEGTIKLEDGGVWKQNAQNAETNIGPMTITDDGENEQWTRSFVSEGGMQKNVWEDGRGYSTEGCFTYTLSHSESSLLTVPDGKKCVIKCWDEDGTVTLTQTITGAYEETEFGFNLDGKYVEERFGEKKLTIEGEYEDTENGFKLDGTYVRVTTIGDKITIDGKYESTENGMIIEAGATETTESADGRKQVITGPYTQTETGAEIGAGGSIVDDEIGIYGPATIAEDGIVLGAGSAIECEGTKITTPAGADVETVLKNNEVIGLKLNPLTDTNGEDVITISGVGTVYLPAMGTVTLTLKDGTFAIDPVSVPIDTDGDGIIDVNIDTDGDGKFDLNVDTDGDYKADLNVDTDGNGKADLNVDRDGNGKPDLNVDKDGNGKLDATDDNVDTDKDGKPNYKVIKGANATWTKSSVWGLQITVNGLYEDVKYGFEYVEVDGVKLNAKQYTAESGSTIITLKASYLQELSLGKHTVKVVYPDGSASTTFTIVEPAIVPATGDNSNVGMWAAVFGGSVLALGAAALMIFKRKREDA